MPASRQAGCGMRRGSGPERQSQGHPLGSHWVCVHGVKDKMHWARRIGAEPHAGSGRGGRGDARDEGDEVRGRGEWPRMFEDHGKVK